MAQQQTRPPARWKGSLKTADAVRTEIARRWGREEAAQYDPTKNCFTLPTWNTLGYRVKKGEHAIRSRTYIEDNDQEQRDEAAGEEQEKHLYPKQVYLFYKKQVEKKE